MKIVLLFIETGKESWLEEIRADYKDKIERFVSFDYLKIKSPSLDRDQRDQKVKLEGQLITNALQPDDYVILLDEKGKAEDSMAFSKRISSLIESGKKRVVIIVGGAFGVSDWVRSRGQITLKLSDMVLSHHTAQVVTLEQLYRALTIWKKIPYHNS